MRLSLGTVQFGLRYGIANTSGQVSASQAADILRVARESGVDTLDTAIAYGASERVLGETGVAGFRVVTKLPPLPTQDVRQMEIREWVQRQVQDSLDRLRLTSLHGLLLHRAADLSEAGGAELHAAMQSLKSRGLVERIGVSIYGPEDLAGIFGRFELDLVQAPFNVVDRRLERSGWLTRLRDRGVAIHARSAFLQGLLLMKERPAYFARWSGLWARWHDWLAGSGARPEAACLQFVLSRDAIERVVVGVDNVGQLRELLSAAQMPQPQPPDDLWSEDVELVNPTHWKAA